MRRCEVEGCERERNYKHYCNMHQHRLDRNGDVNTTTREPNGAGHVTSRGYVRVWVWKERRHTYEHILKAEKALGKRLPKGAHVHHVNNVGWDNNRPWNLVVCPDDAYHKLLHDRSRELGYL